MKQTSVLKSWLELVRLPNLLTVPGDPLVGWLLAGGIAAGSRGQALRVCGISLCLYVAGLLLNDLADLKTDRRERPSRPLPSGRISVAGAWVAAVLALAGSAWLARPLGAAAQGVVAVLVALIFGYNWLWKSVPLLGPAAMGACRALSFLLGAVAVGALPSGAVWIACGGTGIYVAGISANAVDETAPGERGWRRHIPAAGVVLCLGGLGYLTWNSMLDAAPYGVLFFLALAVWAALRCWVVGDLLGARTPLHVPALIGALIGTLPILQAAFAVASGNGGWPVAGLLVGAAWLFPHLARSFYSS